MRTPARNPASGVASEKSPPASTPWHHNMLALSEHIIAKHAADLMARRWKLTASCSYGPADSNWLQQVDRFIDEVLEASGAHVRRSPELLRAVQWMIAGATARFAPSKAPGSLDREMEVVADAA